MAKVKDFFLGLFGGISKDKQIVINGNRELVDQKKPTDFVRATIARIYLTYKKLIQPRNYELEYPDDKLITIKNASRVETYLRRGRDRYVELIWKNGYDFIGKNKIAVNYIKRRFKEIALITEKPTTDLLEEISENIIQYYNAFIIKIRKLGASSGKPHRYFNKIVKPVAGYFVVDPTKMRARIDRKTRQITGWEYEDENLYDYAFRKKEYDFRDVIHITMARPAGQVFGEPAAIPVLNDIRALRRMEENVEILVFQHSIPLYHYAVGTEEKPALDGEVKAVRAEVEDMVTQGMLVTPERHKIVAIGVQREALRVNEYLEYFKTRVLTGLGHSTISLGESGGVSRATAAILAKSVIDSAIKFQRKIRTYVDEFMINELLIEGGFNIFDEKNKVELYIPEIDLDDKIRKEFHILSLWQGNLLTEDEARKELGKDPFTASDRKKTYFELITKPRTLMQSVDEPWLMTFGPKAVANKAIPQNQYGPKKGGATQRTGGDSDNEIILKDSLDDMLGVGDLDKIKKGYSDYFLSQYYAVQEDIYVMIEEKSFNSGKISMNISKTMVIERGSWAIIAAYRRGLKDAGFHIMIPIEADLSMLHNYHIKGINKLFDSILKMINKSKKTKEDIINIFDSQKYRLGFIVDWFVRKSYWLAIASSLRAQGIEEVSVKRFNPDKNDICYSYPDVINLKSPLYIYQIPCHHSHCKCKLDFKNLIKK